MKTEIHTTLLDISPEEWDALNQDGNPFTSYAFLSALEESGCVGSDTGWLPKYICLRDDENRLIAAAPMFEKHHSWGEYVFDWAWANAWQQCGLAYYPKLIIAIPFSPVTGQRFLFSDELSPEVAVKYLQTAAISFAQKGDYSSLHCLFPTQVECEQLQKQRMLIRHDVQFHWENRGYGEFKDFLACMSSRKRKKINRERRRVSETGIEFSVITGCELTLAHMERMYEFYLSTIFAHGSQAYLSEKFFLLLAERLAENIILIEAHHQGEVIAAALNIRHGDVLFGRYWGCKKEFDNLHFETCYYQAIDYCIKNKLSHFEGGAQGEHKLSRGFLPVITSSAHWMADDRLNTAVDDFLQHEKEHVAQYQHMLKQHSPYKSKCNNNE